MVRVVGLQEIKEVMQEEIAIDEVEAGLRLYSQGKAVIAPVGHLPLTDSSGELHVKYGYITGGKYFVVKLATGFWENPSKGLASNNGLMVVFNQLNGVPEYVLLDEGYLTDLRTAAAGAICAKYLAPKDVRRIGIVGTGGQARFQLRLLPYVVGCRDVLVWGRNGGRREQYKKEMEGFGFRIDTTGDPRRITDECNLIVTTTSSTEPVLSADWVKAGTHITAVGADGGGKQELDPRIFHNADLIVADSKSQCMDHGDISYAIREGLILEQKILELGSIIENPLRGRRFESQITVADLTGVAVEDIQVAALVVQALSVH